MADEKFSENIDKFVLINSLNQKNLIPYNLFVWQQMQSDEIKTLKPKERVCTISRMWKERSEELKKDMIWFDKTLEARRLDIEKTEVYKKIARKARLERLLASAKQRKEKQVI